MVTECSVPCVPKMHDRISIFQFFTTKKRKINIRKKMSASFKFLIEMAFSNKYFNYVILSYN